MDWGRTLAAVCLLALAACGRVGFGEHVTAATDAEIGHAIDGPASGHVQAAAGWTVSLLVDLTGVVPYNANDFTDGGGQVYSNAPRYVTSLSPPFVSSLAVIAGRSVIELPISGPPIVHDYRPATPDTTGPDQPGHMTFATLGGKSGLWLSSASQNAGDGLFVIGSDWTINVDSPQSANPLFNNLYAIAVDPTGSFDMTGVATLYEVGQDNGLLRRTGPAAETELTVPGPVDDLAIHGDSVFATIENADDSAVAFDRIGAGPGYIVTELASSMSFTLAEGSTDGGLYGIQDAADLVAMNGTDGTITKVAWSDDPSWQWGGVSAPRAGNPYAGKLVVLESNRALDRDDLLLVTPP